MVNEQWKPISEYEELYEVSNYGNVRSKDRLVKHSSGNGFRPVKGKMKKLCEHGDGYLYVTLSQNGKNKNHYVHRLVADAFIPKIPGKNFVNHIDYNKSNNHVENLEWVTAQENVLYSVPYRNKRSKNPKTGLYGVGIRFRKGKFEVETAHKYIGRFWDLEDAIKARDEFFEYERKEQIKIINSN